MFDSMLTPYMKSFMQRLLPESTIQPMRKPQTMCDFERPEKVTHGRSGASVAVETCSNPSMTRRS